GTGGGQPSSPGKEAGRAGEKWPRGKGDGMDETLRNAETAETMGNAGPRAAQVRVRLFAMLAEAAGRRELVLEVPAGSRVSDVAAALARQVPALAPWVDRVSYALNLEYVRGDAPVRDGDEVALLPP